ncbi:AAA family ATPase [Paenalkalicoccus suaedae]|uniref:AAA family ATPase n=1 Tax=Paenalkalicoccus suaedae TaxID=2592382 RepID=A0A859FF54_9BACI|nr:AAA family ATPase [Paenalkalicoccus suaedae]QKS71332.1 AAA family ATPase [Paenalkalicoccus suaedae]
MNQQKPYKPIDERLEEYKRMPFSNLHEGELVRALEEATTQLEDWYALCAVARYERKKEWDLRIEEWLIKATKQQTSFVNNVVSHIVEKELPVKIFEDAFPKVRETDHSQGKKQQLGRLEAMLEDGRQLLAAKMNLRSYSSDNHLQEKLELLNEIQQSILEALQAVEEYRKTISGIYSSKDKKQELSGKIEQIQSAVAAWDDLQNEEENDEAIEELHRMIGLHEVKKKVESYYQYLQFERERSRQGYQLQHGRSHHMILTGNPGTGKTTIARLLAKIYYKLGVLEREDVVEVDRSQLVGPYVGQTEERTMDVIKQAIGGVLFIDEAYALKREGSQGSDYGQTAIDTLVSAMTNGEYAGRFAVILAGYPEEMRTFLLSNPGLRSRFPESNHLHLPDYSPSELTEIGEQVALDNDFFLTEEGKKALLDRIAKEQVDETFGNARTVHNIILDAIFTQGAKATREENYSRESFAVLDKEAFALDTPSYHAEEKLEALIGLEEVKKQVKQLAAFVKVQQEREDKGLKTVPIQLHSVFTGPPGTGKTTVAEIYGHILHELGLLKRGHLVVAGRSDLVAGYVGQTAVKTKRVIKDALGGVLFIDEAYSLLRGGGEDFGREAIDTLVDEMTKHDENLVVIIAGYEKPIQSLLESNQGLASRFKKTITFKEYSINELLLIADFYLDQFGYELESGVRDKIKEAIIKYPPKANARSMKDLVLEAIQVQAYNVLSEERADVVTLTEKDFAFLLEASS